MHIASRGARVNSFYRAFLIIVQLLDRCGCIKHAILRSDILSHFIDPSGALISIGRHPASVIDV